MSVGPVRHQPNKSDNEDPQQSTTLKTAVIGVAEHGGNVAAMPVDKVTAADIAVMSAMHVNELRSVLMTDTSQLYRRRYGFLPYRTVNHNVQLVDGDIFVNMIAGFWQQLKQAFCGSHHQYTRFWMPFYIAEASWNYYHRKDADPFGSFFQQCSPIRKRKVGR